MNSMRTLFLPSSISRKLLTFILNFLTPYLDQNATLQVKSAKALNLLFLNRYHEGQQILKELLNNTKDPIDNEGLNMYLNKSGREIILMFLTGEENKTVSPTQQPCLVLDLL